MNRKLIASLALVTTALTLGSSAFAQSGSNPVIQSDVTKLKSDKAAAKVAHDKLHADKQLLKADKARATHRQSPRTKQPSPMTSRH